MKTPDEIKRGLEHCSTKKPCTCCPMWEECKEAGSLKPLWDNALSYIQQLEERLGEVNKTYLKLVAQVAKGIDVSPVKWRSMNGEECEVPFGKMQVPKWISVEEPPKVKGAYLVRLKYPSWNLFHPDHGWCEVDEYMNSTLTHWMAFEDLPEPPKEDV